VCGLKGRIPGTDKWTPIDENREAPEEVPGVLIIRIRENLDFGMSFLYYCSLYSLAYTYGTSKLTPLSSKVRT
jgi:hypothetical protein